MKSRPHVTVWLLCGVALALRAGWVIYRWTTHGAAFDYPDEDLHWQLATHLVHDGTLMTDDGRLAARMPLYPLFLAAFAGLGQTGILLARLAQAALGAATVLIAYRFAAAAFDRRAALVAGLLVSCDPFAVFFSNLLLTEVLFTLMAVSLTSCAWLLLWRARHHFRAALLGVALLGPAVVLTRPSAAGWIPLLWLLIVWLSTDRPRTFLRLLVCPVALVVLMLPWGVRNRAALGSWAWLSANGGVTLYDAQGPQADGSSNQAFLANMPELKGLDEIARDQMLQRRARQHMRDDPGRVLRLAAVKLQRTWSLTPNVAEYRGGPVALVSAAYTALVLLAALVGLVRAATQRLRPHQATFRPPAPSPRAFHALIWLPVVYFSLLHCIYVGSLRYRVPLMPFVCLAAAGAVAAPYSIQRAASRRET